MSKMHRDAVKYFDRFSDRLRVKVSKGGAIVFTPIRPADGVLQSDKRIRLTREQVIAAAMYHAEHSIVPTGVSLKLFLQLEREHAND